MGKGERIINLKAPRMYLRITAMASSKIKTKKAEPRPTDVEGEFMESLIRGIEDYKAGRVTICRNKDEALEHLKQLLAE
ncbi:MAG: hypothetical protein JW986_09225 [Methanotrichaceae archaeon]|nr:hypothetical protein [Methanotrichaceae archaeon]